MGIEWHTLRIWNITDWQHIANHAGDAPPQHASDSPLESLEHARNLSPEHANDSSRRRTSNLSPQRANDLSPQHANNLSPQRANDSSPQRAIDSSPQRATDLSPQRANAPSPRCTNDLSPLMLQHPNDPSPQPTTSLSFHRADIAADTAQPWDAGMDDSHVRDAQETLPAFQGCVSQSRSVAVPMTDNPYGSDLVMAAAYVDDNDDDEGYWHELDDEFALWYDEEDQPAESAPADVANSGVHQGQPHSSMPTWLKSDYLRVRDHLVKEMKNNPSHLPTCYDRHTFYDGPENRFLAARASYDGSAAGIFHQHHYFVWLPHLLVKRIPCPACKQAQCQGAETPTVYLQKHSFVESPRRVVNIEENVFLIGYRYRCGHKACRKTYQSWSPSILAVLPGAVSDQFTFQLTCRAGLTDRLATLLRETSRGGTSPRVFTTLVQTFHYRRFDKLRCQFLEMVADHTVGTLGDCWTSKRPFGEFGDRGGFAGYVPSQGYFGRFYDMMVEAEAPELQQMISSRPANVLKHDHSFKVLFVPTGLWSTLLTVHQVIKHMKKQGGVAFFAALHTFLNEYSEICGMTFTPSKAHDGWAPVLQAILPSLRDYGHSEPQVVFTDNVRADRDKLMSIFPSLSAGVVPIEPIAPLECLAVPSDWEVVHLTNTHQVNLRFNIIMSHHSDATPVTVGIGMQWPINPSTGVSGHVALLVFTYERTVYLIQVCSWFVLTNFQMTDLAIEIRPSISYEMGIFAFPMPL